MNHKLTLLLILGLVFGLMSSCKKEDKSSRKELLTATSCWKISKYEEKDESGKYVDVTEENYETCELDDCNRFAADGNFTVTDDGEKCSGSSTHSGTWTLSADEKQLTINTVFFPIILNIESMDSNTLVVTYTLFETEARVTYKN